MRNKRYHLLIASAVVLNIVMSSCGLVNQLISPTNASTPSQLPSTQIPIAAGSITPTATITGDYSNSSGGQVEVFSWWTAPGSSDGLAALAKVFEQMYSNTSFVNAAAAVGAGTDPKTVLADRLATGNPPDSWQSSAGQETIANYAAAGQIQPLDDFFQSTGLNLVLPPALLPLISQGGHPYSVPVDIQRSNVLWYNPKVLQTAGVTVDPQTGLSDWSTFFTACNQIKAAGKTCLALGPDWTSMLLFENVMVGDLGPDQWAGLWVSPPTTDWIGPAVKTAIADFTKALSYTNSNASTLPDWQSAVKMVADGEAAFTIMGDWAYAYFTDPTPDGAGLQPHTDFDWAVSPANYGIFDFLSDSFVMPAKPRNPANSTAWLAAAASKAGQEAFNPLNGSICARTDCDPSLFNEYSQAAAKDWATSRIVGSLTFGAAASPSWQNSIQSTLDQFLGSAKDLNAQAGFQRALAAACSSNGSCK